MSPASIECKVYKNNGNLGLLRLVPLDARRILDVGCGAGDNARNIKQLIADAIIDGITTSENEKTCAIQYMDSCSIVDIESDFSELLVEHELYDVLLFSHVLEHLRDPDLVLERMLQLLKPGGVILIAVPNILHWRMRFQFLLGDFTYQDAGILDNTHLRFFTFATAKEYLLSKVDMVVEVNTVDGSAPLWILRRHVFPVRVSKWVDRLICKMWPNLFGEQVLIRAHKKRDRECNV
jgi:2-polyprenyl-3-methyl-5-hydroxy-6-metoxy-1,4-benzoquinol methylase